MHVHKMPHMSDKTLDGLAQTLAQQNQLENYEHRNREHRSNTGAVARFICRDCNHKMFPHHSGNGLTCSNPQCNRWLAR